MVEVLFISLNCRKIVVEVVIDIIYSILYKYIYIYTRDVQNTIFMIYLDHGIFLNEKTTIIKNCIKL